MMRIEGHWETIDSFEDVSRVIREYYNRELADELDELIGINKEEIKTLENDIINLECYLYDLNSRGIHDSD
jgi:hypothetical protein